MISYQLTNIIHYTESCMHKYTDGPSSCKLWGFVLALEQNCLQCNRSSYIFYLPRFRRSSTHSSFQSLGPKLWNNLPDNIWQAPALQLLNLRVKHIWKQQQNLTLCNQRQFTLCIIYNYIFLSYYYYYIVYFQLPSVCTVRFILVLFSLISVLIIVF